MTILILAALAVPVVCCAALVLVLYVAAHRGAVGESR